jgi:hypothetical protein
MVISFARLHGWLVFHQRPGLTRGGRWVSHTQGNGKGWPDLCLVRGKRLVFAELKIPPNTTTPEQDGWLSALRETPAEVYLWTPDHWQVITQILGR